MCGWQTFSGVAAVSVHRHHGGWRTIRDSSAATQLGISLRGWEEALRSYFDEGGAVKPVISDNASRANTEQRV